jgi:hypothetical protein
MFQERNKPPVAGNHNAIFRSTTANPYPSYPHSPRKSFNLSPSSSSSHITLGGGRSSTNYFFGGEAGSNGGISGTGSGSSFIPWFKSLPSAGGPPFPSYGAANFSAPVTPPAGSSPPVTPHLNKMARWASDNAAGSSAAHALPPWVTGSSSSRYAVQNYTTPSSPTRRRALPDPATWLPGFQAPSSAKGKEPAYGNAPLLSAYAAAAAASSSRLGLPKLNSCPHSPAVPHGGAVARHPDDGKKAQDASTDCSLTLGGGHAMVSAWEGEVIKECNEEELELTLGSSETRADRV